MGRGYSSRGDILTRTTDGVDLNSIWDEFIETVSIVNAQRQAITALLTYDTTNPSEVVGQGESKEDFEESSEFGVPQSIRAEAEPLLLGTPLRWFDLAIRYTESFLRDADARQIRAQHAAALDANDRLLFTHTMRALLTKTTETTRPQNDSGTTIYSLWDGEADATPPAFAGQSFEPGHTHYLTTQSTQIDGADLRVLIRHIAEHGYGILPGERIVILVHPNQGEVIRGFRAGVAGSPYDFIASEAAPAYLTTEQIVGERPPAEFRGLPVLGSYGPALIVEDWYAIPGYVIATATSGTNSTRNPLAFREHKRSEYRGLRVIPGEQPRYPLLGATYAQGFGVAVRNRGAAAVMQVTTDAEYVSPSL